MPSKNHNVRANTATRALQAVPDTTPASAGRTVAEDKLRATLNAHPATTTANLAVLAGIGRSTAGKILASWATEGSVARSPGSVQGGRGGGDTWTICEATVDHGTDPAVDQWLDVAVTDEPVPDAAPGTTDDTGGEVADFPNRDAAEQPEFPGTLHDQGSASTKAPRLGKGALRGMVEDYLTEHPGEQFSPSAIGKALNRSSGAVNNALDKLVADGYAIQIQDKPKRFRINATVSESADR
jgi:predicted transcriptional regulator